MPLLRFSSLYSTCYSASVTTLSKTATPLPTSWSLDTRCVRCLGGSYRLQFCGTHAVSLAKVISLWTRTYNLGEYRCREGRRKSTSGSVRLIEETGATQLLLLGSWSQVFYVTDTAVFGLTHKLHPEGWHSICPECCFWAGTLAMSSVGPHSPL